MTGLRNYQKEIEEGAHRALSSGLNTLIQADTGAGKTRILAAIACRYNNVLLVAHRNTLVSQLSLEFAKAGLQHGMLTAKTTRRRAELLHRRHLGKSAISTTAGRYVCSVDTILSQARRNTLNIDCSKSWLIIVDEAHHMVEENKWGKLCAIFRNSLVLGATATPARLDGVMLRRGNGGVFDILVQAESLKNGSVEKLITGGFLSPFKCYGIEPRININALVMGKHDYTSVSLISETENHAQAMAGDAVEHYRRLANGKRAVAFCVSIEFAELTAEMYRKSGISSAAIHSKMGRTEIDRIFDLFESGQIQVLCNVDMTGEGVDIPAIEVLIMLRKTASLTLYRQWIGRSLRPCTGKDFAIIIDHADNVRKHGLPDGDIEWSLDRNPAEQKSNLMPCPGCRALVKAWEAVCPECGEVFKSESGAGNQKSAVYIDYQLVEIYRTREAQESRDNAIAITIPAEQIAHLIKNGGKASEITTRVALWFFDNIKENVTRKQAENFFFKYNNMQFWASNFTLEEIKKPNEKKCMRVFNEAQNNKH